MVSVPSKRSDYDLLRPYLRVPYSSRMARWYSCNKVCTLVKFVMSAFTLLQFESAGLVNFFKGGFLVINFVFDVNSDQHIFVPQSSVLSLF